MNSTIRLDYEYLYIQRGTLNKSPNGAAMLLKFTGTVKIHSSDVGSLIEKGRKFVGESASCF